MRPGRASHAAVIVAIAVAPLGAQGTGPAPQQDEAVQAFAEGQRELAAGNVGTAIALLDRAARLAPDEPSVRFVRGLAYYAAGDDERALAEFRHVIALDPRHAGAWNGVGNVRNRQREPREALDAYRRALALDPGLLIAAWHAGWTAEQIEDLDAAEAAYRACLVATPRAEHEAARQREARFRLGALRYRARDYEESAELMREVVRQEPSHPRAHHYLGQALVRLGRRAEGERHLLRHREIVAERRTGGTVANADADPR